MAPPDLGPALTAVSGPHGQLHERTKAGARAAGLSAASNIILCMLKGTVGYLGHSTALLADAVHSLADAVNSLAALISIFYGAKPADQSHPYGHGRVEALVATFSAFVILAAGALVGYDSARALMTRDIAPPSLAALLVALAVIPLKVLLSRYVSAIGRSIKSKSILADARDHTTDVLASLIVVVGIAGAKLGAPWLDAAAGIVIAVFIAVMAARIVFDASLELMDTSLTLDVRERIKSIAAETPGVQSITGIAGRTIAHQTLVEIHLDVDPSLTVGEGGRIVDLVKEAVIARVDGVGVVVIELNSNVFEPDALH